MKVQRGDLVLSTQGRSFWILDDLAPLRQISDAIATGGVHIFAPRDAYRFLYNAGFGGAESNRASSGDPQYPQAGAMIDYWLPSDALPVSMEIVAPDGKVVRRLSSEVTDPAASAEAAGAQRLTRVSGLNRVIWDMSYPGPWDANARRNGRSGPMAAPGTYTVRLSAGGATATQRLVLRADPRVIADGVTPAIMREQLAHNLHVRDLVTDVNRAVASLSAARSKAREGSPARARIDAIDKILVTPPIRYSRPGLQAQIQYLYGAAFGADQKVPNDAVLRYAQLKRELDAVKKNLSALDQ
jgi:hypothetical protein